MKKWFLYVLAAVLLCGCGAQPVFETVDDDDSLFVSATVRQIQLTLPREAAKPAMQTDTGDSLYLCDGYTLQVQTFSGGDMDRTLRQLTGYCTDQLQPIRTKTAEATRYDLTWISAGEGGDQVGRAVVLDDGLNHSTVSVMAEAAKAGRLQKTWQSLMNSVGFSTD